MGPTQMMVSSGFAEIVLAGHVDGPTCSASRTIPEGRPDGSEVSAGAEGVLLSDRPSGPLGGCPPQADSKASAAISGATTLPVVMR